MGSSVGRKVKMILDVTSVVGGNNSLRIWSLDINMGKHKSKFIRKSNQVSRLGSHGLNRLSGLVEDCRLCPRLVEHREIIARKKIRRFKDWTYWGRPVPGFGVQDARLLIIGLALGAHGANRTGQLFTGDASGEWLFKALNEAGLANKVASVHRDDGLEVYYTFISATVRCTPPGNKPSTDERKNCLQYLKEEIALLDKVRVVITLGKAAFDTYLCCLGIKNGLKFKHQAHYRPHDKLDLIVSYHPSRQNTQTKKLTWDSWISIFNLAKKLLRG
jgi:uracil-DNA glycosylase family 4